MILAMTAMSCQQDQNQQELASFKEQFDSLFTERQIAWDSMMVEDDTKIRYMSRLLDEISYQLPYDEFKMEQLRSNIQALAGIRFTIDELTQSEKVDAYDAATDSVLSALVSFVTFTPQASEIPLVGELMSDIRQMDNFVLQRRNRFDDATMALNQHIEQNPGKLEALGGQYADVKPFPMFLLYPG